MTLSCMSAVHTTVSHYSRLYYSLLLQPQMLMGATSLDHKHLTCHVCMAVAARLRQCVTPTALRARLGLPP